jgi:small ligand-binding sensory domain FIST
MERFRSAHASAGDWREAVRLCLDRLGTLPPGANLGFLYATDVFAPQLARIYEHFRDHTGVETWVGSVGVGICAVGKEYYERGALSVLVGAFPRDSFRVFAALRDDAEELLEAHGEWIQQRGVRFGVVHGDPRNPKTPELVEELSSALDEGFLVGGITSSRGPTYQIAGGVTEGGLSGVLFAPEVAVATSLTQGCTPFGSEHEVTECRRNVVGEIDGRPALDVFNEEVGETIARDPDRAAGYIFVALPVRGSDTGDYLVRNLLGMDLQNRLLAIGEELSPGDRLRFCRRDRGTARADLARMLRELHDRAGHAPGGGVYYSCLGRGQAMFGQGSQELGMIRGELGDLPLAGFFANGEISHRRLYGYTGVLTLFL